MVVGLLETQLRMTLSNVAFPAMSSMQDDINRFWNYYRKFLLALAFLTMPAAVFLFVFADKIVLWYLGAKWTAAVPYLRVFSLGAFITPVMYSLDRIPLALGRNKQYMWLGILGSMFKFFSIVVGVVGWGAMGCAIAIVLSDYILWVPFFYVATSGTPIKWLNYMRVLIAPVAITLPVGVLFWAVRVYFNFSEDLFILLSEMCLIIILFLFLFFLVDVLNLGTDLNFVKAARKKICANSANN